MLIGNNIYKGGTPREEVWAPGSRARPLVNYALQPMNEQKDTPPGVSTPPEEVWKVEAPMIRTRGEATHKAQGRLRTVEAESRRMLLAALRDELVHVGGNSVREK